MTNHEYCCVLKETLPQLIRRSLADDREAALLERVTGTWTAISAHELQRRVDDLACAIRFAGLQKGDRVALIAGDCVNWIAADFAILCAGCVVVPIFPTQASDQVRYILQNSEAKLIFTDTVAAAERLAHVGVALPPIVVFEGDGAGSLAEFEAAGAAVRVQHPEQPQLFEAELSPDELAVLIYTSGTTGEPKGVMLSHFNLVFTAQSSFSTAFDILTEGSPVLSVLPFSHIYEHCIIYGYMLTKVRHHICRHVDELVTDLQEVRPVAMTSVPRIFERMIAGVTAKARVHGGAQAKLVPWVLRAGRDYMTAKALGKGASPLLTIKYRLAHALVLKRVRERLGLDRVKFLVSGSAPLHVDTAMTLLGIGIPILEGYGPTECSPVITVNTYHENRYGTVGRPIAGVEIKLAPDGEILARGPNVMMGYYRDPKATSDVIEDGWYHTGDIGAIDTLGYLRITDRKKELFKTSGGKFVAPARVESAIKRSVYVNQVMLVGDGRPYPAALVSPNWELVRAELGIDPAVPVDQLVERSDVHLLITKEVYDHTKDLAKFEQVRKVAILPRELSVEAGDLSPTLKVKRRVVESRYAREIDNLYAGEEQRAVSYA
ncbi:MAG TPA: long-chain fatty acid--CoA ligase [Candidatus Baltobacteraceae bacterium]|nr:long-chain fatty acid--CoA ligase [Candidatus Baltobacteraceae bacterium]